MDFSQIFISTNIYKWDLRFSPENISSCMLHYLSIQSSIHQPHSWVFNTLCNINMEKQQQVLYIIGYQVYGFFMPFFGFSTLIEIRFYKTFMTLAS